MSNFSRKQSTKAPRRRRPSPQMPTRAPRYTLRLCSTNMIGPNVWADRCRPRRTAHADFDPQQFEEPQILLWAYKKGCTVNKV